ncbi:MAG: hypothetical protein JOZ75_09010 [Candidatus Dormibacteraeota bacterium]|nr:hypothetical protein [Candidatus Dormibacteraeota bacterium]
MPNWVRVTIDVEGTLSVERTYVNLDRVTHLQQVQDGETLLHFDSGDHLSVKETADELVATIAQSLRASSTVSVGVPVGGGSESGSAIAVG